LIVEQIKKYLIMENLVDEEEFIELYDGNLDLAWENYIDNQEIGDCQSIVSEITMEFEEAVKVFGEIEVDEPYIDQYGKKQNLMVHHWVEINGNIYDFSKGTLSNHIEWENIYSVEPNDEGWRYN
jgi:hypothetical protein